MVVKGIMMGEVLSTSMLDRPMKRERDTVAQAFPATALPMVSSLFPDMKPDRLALLGSLATLVKMWNDRVNLISRKDADHIEEHHILMSLLMTKVWTPKEDSRVLDLGTGGGFPGIPLAIMFPQTNFFLLDSIAKKAKAVQDVVDALKLPNVTVITSRAEKVTQQFDLVIGRAVTALPQFLRWASPLLNANGGVLYFKGTRWVEELEGSSLRPAEVHDCEALCPQPFFAGKFILRFNAPIVLEDHIRHDSNVNMHANEKRDKPKFKKFKK